MIWTIPNMLTLFRVLLVPVFVFFLLGDGFVARCVALFLFLLAALTDYLDGRIARSFNQRSELGNFADPLADKLLVAAALIAFAHIPEACVPLWAIILIISREVIITCLRIFALKRDEVVETSFSGKSKTAAQMITIAIILALLTAQAYKTEHLPKTETWSTFNLCWDCDPHIGMYCDCGFKVKWEAPAHKYTAIKETPELFWKIYAGGANWGTIVQTIPLALMLITCFLTLHSGIVYLWRNRRMFNDRRS